MHSVVEISGNRDRQHAEFGSFRTRRAPREAARTAPATPFLANPPLTATEPRGRNQDILDKHGPTGISAAVACPRARGQELKYSSEVAAPRTGRLETLAKHPRSAGFQPAKRTKRDNADRPRATVIQDVRATPHAHRSSSSPRNVGLPADNSSRIRLPLERQTSIRDQTKRTGQNKQCGQDAPLPGRTATALRARLAACRAASASRHRRLGPANARLNYLTFKFRNLIY